MKYAEIFKETKDNGNTIEIMQVKRYDDGHYAYKIKGSDKPFKRVKKSTIENLCDVYLTKEELAKFVPMTREGIENFDGEVINAEAMKEEVETDRKNVTAWRYEEEKCETALQKIEKLAFGRRIKRGYEAIRQIVGKQIYSFNDVTLPHVVAVKESLKVLHDTMSWENRNDFNYEETKLMFQNIHNITKSRYQYI